MILPCVKNVASVCRYKVQTKNYIYRLDHQQKFFLKLSSIMLYLEYPTYHLPHNFIKITRLSYTKVHIEPRMHINSVH